MNQKEKTLPPSWMMASLACMLALLSDPSNGNTDPDPILLSLSTDGNQSVIQQNGPRTAADIPNKGLHFTLTVTAPGTTQTTVEIKQVQETGGTGLP